MSDNKPGWWRTAKISRAIMLEYQIYMSLHERDVLSFIFSRTCIWNNMWERIPLRHFMHGIMEEATGRTIAAPVSMGEAKLLESLKQLEGKGIIQVRRHPTLASQYKITDPEDFDIENALAFMRRHQRKHYISHFGKIGKRSITQIAATHRNTFDVQSRMTREMLRSQYPEYPLGRGNASPYIEGTAPSNQREYNIDTLNLETLNVSAPGRRTGLRKVHLPK